MVGFFVKVKARYTKGNNPNRMHSKNQKWPEITIGSSGQCPNCTDRIPWTIVGSVPKLPHRFLYGRREEALNFLIFPLRHRYHYCKWNSKVNWTKLRYYKIALSVVLPYPLSVHVFAILSYLKEITRNEFTAAYSVRFRNTKNMQAIKVCFSSDREIFKNLQTRSQLPLHTILEAIQNACHCPKNLARINFSWSNQTKVDRVNKAVNERVTRAGAAL